MFAITSSYRVQGEKYRVEEQCYNCKEENCIIVTPFYNLHCVFFIPLYCYEIEYEGSCENCQADIPLDKSDLDKDTRRSIYRSALLMSSMAILIALLGLIYLISTIDWTKTDKQKSNFDSFNLVDYPQQGNSYLLKYGDANLLFIEVNNVTVDSIAFSEYRFTTQEYDTIGNVLFDVYFGKKANKREPMSLDEFKSYIDTGSVYKVGTTIFPR